VTDAHVGHRLDLDVEGGGDGCTGLGDEEGGCSLDTGSGGGGNSESGGDVDAHRYRRCLIGNGEDGDNGDTRGRDAQCDEAVGRIAAGLVLQLFSQSVLLGRTERAHVAAHCEVQLDDGGRRGDDGLTGGER
jgi:hypothetical protein